MLILKMLVEIVITLIIYIYIFFILDVFVETMTAAASGEAMCIFVLYCNLHPELLPF